MNLKKHTYGYRFLLIAIAITLLLPSVVKFAHSLNHHQHSVCEGNSDLHFHKKDLDCDFYKFKLSKDFSWALNIEDELEVYSSFNYNSILYQTQYSHFIAHFQLRAPPVS